MKLKIAIGSVVILAAVVFGAISFVETNVEYTDFHTAAETGKKVQVKGEWQKDQSSAYDAGLNQFTFFMKDDNGVTEKVVFDGVKPNNFEIANAIVVKGRYERDCFHASDILTKCPSKYEADAETVKKSL
ncbi:MAG TPA: cytochrome c maturation protein CcmE [Bacteroidota bacterium]|nr:cytochrome c maturation protein CcmE [Bacteroidota bacterium]